MIWTSLEQICQAFDLPLSPSDTDAIRHALIKRLSDVHPDTTGGRFGSEQQEVFYFRIKDAIDFVERRSALPMTISIDHIRALAEVLRAQPPPAPAPSPTKSGRTFLPSLLKGRYAFPALTSAMVSSLCVATLALLPTIEQHPFYKAVQADLVRATLCERLRYDQGLFALPTALEPVPDEMSQVMVTLRDHAPCADPVGFLDRLIEASTEATSALDASIEKSLSAVQQIAADLAKETKGRETFDPAEIECGSSGEGPGFRELGPDRVGGPGPIMSRLERAARRYCLQVALRRHLSPIAAPGLVRMKRAAEDRANRQIQSMLIVLLSLGATAYCILWLRERSDEAWIAALRGDARPYVSERLEQYLASQSRRTFSTTEFRRIAAAKRLPWYLLFLGRSVRFEQHPAALDNLLSDLLSRGAIKKLPTNSADDWYELCPQDPSRTDGRPAPPRQDQLTGSP